MAEPQTTKHGSGAGNSKSWNKTKQRTPFYHPPIRVVDFLRLTLHTEPPSFPSSLRPPTPEAQFLASSLSFHTPNLSPIHPLALLLHPALPPSNTSRAHIPRRLRHQHSYLLPRRLLQLIKHPVRLLHPWLPRRALSSCRASSRGSAASGAGGATAGASAASATPAFDCAVGSVGMRLAEVTQEKGVPGGGKGGEGNERKGNKEGSKSDNAKSK